MKIVAAHPGMSFSVHDVHVGWVEGLRQIGHQVAEYNLAERITFYNSALIELPDKKVRKAMTPEQAFDSAVNGLYSTLYRLKPDILFVTSAFFYPPELFAMAQSYGTRIVLMHTESPYEDERQLKLAEHVDVNLLNDPTHLEKFRRLNANSHYVPHSYRPGFHCPGKVNPDVAADFAFVGTGYPSRIHFLDAMDFGSLDVLLAGNWQLLSDGSPLRKHVAHDMVECLDNEQTVDVYRSAKVGLNLYRKEADNADDILGWSCGPREIEMAACGMFFLREQRGESDELFPMLPVVRDPEEAASRLHFYVKHESLRRSMANQARVAIEDRTFKNRASDLMRLLGE